MDSEEATSENCSKAFGPERWNDLRSQADSFLHDVGVNVTPFSGLTANAVAHLRSDWIEWRDDFVIIRVPAEADCNSWRLGGGRFGKPNLSERNEPCWYCQNHGTTGAFENLWNSGRRRYTATLHRDIAEPAVDVLDKVFNNWGRGGIHAAPVSVIKAVGRLFPDENKSDYSKLLRTGVALYCHYGLSVSGIADISPFTESNVRNILRATPEVTNKQNNSYTYLRAISQNEPTTVQVVAQKCNVCERSVRQVLKHLKGRNRVEVDKNEWPREWLIVGDWTEPFVCERDTCSYQSPTIRGIVNHEQSHDK